MGFDETTEKKKRAETNLIITQNPVYDYRLQDTIRNIDVDRDSLQQHTDIPHTYRGNVKEMEQQQQQQKML